jgi:two-component system CheB/CheR fusion protein
LRKIVPNLDVFFKQLWCTALEFVLSGKSSKSLGKSRMSLLLVPEIPLYIVFLVPRARQRAETAIYMCPSRSKKSSRKPASKKKPAGSGSSLAWEPNSDSFPVVGIGASAGGLEAFTTFLGALPAEVGMAFVIVPHLDPFRESAFTQILSRSTSMPVSQIEDGMPVEVNHIYVIPPNCDLTIEKAVLHIRDRREPRTVNMTIDIFFRSLAADQGKNAIGVVLSGTASDGTLGLAAIKGEGGITFAQDTHSAKYDGMPASAIASGYVDFILPPEGIAQELAHIRSHPYVAGEMSEAEEGQELRDSHLGQVFRLLRRATGVDFSEYKPPTIGRRIQRRMALKKIRKLSDYSTLLHSDRAEVQALYQDFLINVTSFFRNPESFELLKKEVYPAILKARGNSTSAIRIWVPGCSTGEETYSLAISLMELLGEDKTGISVQIFGTDLSDVAVKKARSGIYKESIEADVSAARLRRFFHRTDSGYQISKAIRDLCIFSTQNVFNDPPFSRIDLISCRNVMIYLSQSLQKKVIPIFHYALNRAGFLMIGSTEGLLGAGSELFDVVDKKQKIYRKRPVSTPMTFGFAIGSTDSQRELTDPSAPSSKRDDSAKAPGEVQREADRLLLAAYAPPAVVINDELEILQTRGRTGSFLELPHGKASLHLLKMARPGLLFELQKAIEEVRHNKAEATRNNVHVESDGKTALVTIRVFPFNSRSEQNNFLVVFEPAADGPQVAPQPAPSGPLTDEERATKDDQVAQLHQELAATKEYLQAIIEGQEATNEELQSANEEIQSGNEELQSTNEELQTSKEELESANEELHTVNEEMQHRNELLAQVNNDLNNLLDNVNLAMVMVGPDLAVRRFTLQAGIFLGLLNTDVGRPVPRLKLNLDKARLEQMMLDVIREAETKQLEVKDNTGTPCRLRISPYRTLDNRVDGAVLSVVEIEATKSPGIQPSADTPVRKTQRKAPMRRRGK